MSNAALAIRNVFLGFCAALIIAQYGPDIGLVWLAGKAAPIGEEKP